MLKAKSDKNTKLDTVIAKKQHNRDEETLKAKHGEQQNSKMY